MDYRDLNGNGRLDPYEDPRRPVEERVDDLLAQLTLEEKAGLMYHPPIGIGPDGSLLDEPAPFSPVPTSELVRGRHINHFNIYWSPGPRETAAWHNRLQRLAEETRLGIPVTISSDPRHGFSDNPATSLSSGALSSWPEPIGLAAAGDAELVRAFADIARQEYLALGIRTALHPTADLCTEPRWARTSGTFGEDAELASRLLAAYIRGFQGDELGPEGVACMTKHFPGGGPQADGEDPHFATGKDQIYPGGNFEYHLRPFEAAFAAGTAAIMPYYGRPVGTELEEVGFGFNQQVVTGLLRERFGYDGVVCTDWGLVTDADLGDWVFPAKCWGVEELSAADRLAKIIDAGCDQLGGENDPALLVELVRSGRVDEARLDESVRRLLRVKFRLGLFDDPYVDEDAAARIAGRDDFRRAGEDAQRRSLVLLANDGALPVRSQPRLYVEGVDRETAAAYGDVVDAPEDADLAVLRIAAPYEPREGFLESMFHQGSLEFPVAERERIRGVTERVPTVVDVFLDRPAILTEVAAGAAALVASFGAADAAVLDLVFGRFAPSGKLPFELPSSTAAVLQQLPDVPYDSESPLFAFGHGLTY
ncbi:MAG TPA: glycoside hydrolase family 3 N-terminal domain-containing protein [Gaiellaceae bacterium]